MCVCVCLSMCVCVCVCEFECVPFPFRVEIKVFDCVLFVLTVEPIVVGMWSRGLCPCELAYLPYVRNTS